MDTTPGAEARVPATVAGRLKAPASHRPTPQTAQRGRAARPLMRKVEVTHLDRRGAVRASSHLVPAIPLFDAPFMAFARGTLIATPMGRVAIEDIVPGMDVSTSDGAAETVLWKGSTTPVPGAERQSAAAGQLTRIAREVLGMDRPSHDLLLGCGACVLRGQMRRLVPASELVDGETAFTVRPPTPVRVYHLALEHHAAICAGGLPLESFHPGAALRQFSHPSIRALYASLFPHLRDFADFDHVAFPREDLDDLISLFT